MKKNLIFILLFTVITNSFAITIDELLDGYAKNDTELAELLIKLDQQKISLQKTYIQQGINVNFSAGNTSIDFKGTEPVFSISPKVTVDIPCINSNISASTTYENEEIKSTSFDISTRLIDSVSNNRDLILKKAERDLELAERNLINRLTELRIVFFNELKKLYSNQNAVSSAQDDLIEKQESLDLIKAQGYAPSSASYRTKEIAVKTAEWNIEENQRTFNTQLNNFLVNCGFERNIIAEVPILPESIASVEIDSINNYDSSNYKNLEETLWNINYAKEQQELKTDFTLSADFGYDNTMNQEKNKRENSATAGVSGDWSGLKASANVEVPFENPEEFRLNLGFTWDLNATRNYSLDKQSDILNIHLNKLTEQKALDNFEKQVQNSLTEEKDLKWQKDNKLEEFELYEQLYIDTQEWFEQGLVSSSDLLRAKTDYERTLISANEVLIDIMIHNLELSQLFIQE